MQDNLVTPPNRPERLLVSLRTQRRGHQPIQSTLQDSVDTLHVVPGDSRDGKGEAVAIGVDVGEMVGVAVGVEVGIASTVA